MTYRLYLFKKKNEMGAILLTYGMSLSTVVSSGGVLEASSPTYSKRKPNNF